MKKKFCAILFTLCLVMSLSTNAFAATVDAAAYDEEWPETKTETTVTEPACDAISIIDDDPVLPDPIPEVEPNGPVGIPPRVISSWLSEQIVLEVDYCEVYGTNGATVVHLRLSDATKIIFVADQLCPTGYTDDGGYYASDISVPCGISRQLYRYLDTVSSAAAMYDFDGVTTLTAKYSPEELTAIYEDVREAALPYHGELIEWLDNFSVTIRVPNYGTLWDGIIVPQPEPIEETAPIITAIP